MKLTIKVTWIPSWEKQEKCNDCDGIAIRRLKYPRLKPIVVCCECYKEYYKDQVERKLT